MPIGVKFRTCREYAKHYQRVGAGCDARTRHVYSERVRHIMRTRSLYTCVVGYCGGTCNNGTMVPHKEIQRHNGTPQEKFYSLVILGHNREDNQVPHKCHVYGCVHVQ